MASPTLPSRRREEPALNEAERGGTHQVGGIGYHFAGTTAPSDADATAAAYLPKTPDL